MIRLPTLLIVLVWLLPPGSAAYGLEIEQVVWGFDGQVVEQRFNPVSVLLSNPAPEPFDGWVRLRRSLGPGNPVDAPIEEPLYLDSFASRWVQLYPYVTRSVDQWTLSWGPAHGGSGTLPSPRTGRPGIVLLEESDTLTAAGAGLKRLPDNLFPPMVAATDGLGAVFLDHVPRWEASRRQAFLDWIRAGGSVHVLQGASGRFPEFPAPLTELNGPLERRPLGAGYVTRHALTRSDLTAEFVAAAVRRDRPNLFPPEKKPEAANQDFTAYGRYESFSPDLVLLPLREMTQPEHSWGLIGLLSIIYVVMVFPGCKLIGQRWDDYRLTHLLLLGTVALFSMLFAVVGRRGYGERTAVHSVAIARVIGENAYEVSQWSNLFVTTGDYYEIKHRGHGSLYSACSDHEAVNGAIRNGLDGSFMVDIPPFSARGVAHRTKISGPVLSATVESFRADESLHTLVLRTGATFPKDAKEIYALHGNQLFRMSRQSGRLVIDERTGSVRNYLWPEDFQFEQFGSNPWTDEEPSDDERFAELAAPLISQSLGLVTRQDAEAFRLPDNRVRLFVYAPMPQEFFTTDTAFASQQGCVLYVTDLFPRDDEQGTTDN